MLAHCQWMAVIQVLSDPNTLTSWAGIVRIGAYPHCKVRMPQRTRTCPALEQLANGAKGSLKDTFKCWIPSITCITRGFEQQLFSKNSNNTSLGLISKMSLSYVHILSICYTSLLQDKLALMNPPQDRRSCQDSRANGDQRRASGSASR